MCAWMSVEPVLSDIIELYVHCTLCNVHCIMYIVHCIMYNLQDCIMYIVCNSILYIYTELSKIVLYAQDRLKCFYMFNTI